MLALVPVVSASDLEAAAKREADAQNTQPVIQELAAHVRRRWESMKDAKRDVEDRMLKALRQRRGEYEPDVLRDIQAMGGSEVYVMLTSVKCRAATSWLRDALLGSGADKPWELDATPIPELPQTIVGELQNRLAQELFAVYTQGGMPPPPDQLRRIAQDMKDMALADLKAEAEKRVERAERKMEDQLAEGGMSRAFSEFIDDVATFPFAVLKGPVVRRRKALEWKGDELVATEKLVEEWERVDPFNFYWSAWASRVDDGAIIERHKLTRDDLEALIGVDGYSESSIRAVLADWQTGLLNEWTDVDSAKADAEGKDVTEVMHTPDLIDALQLWDSVQGKLLIEWGMPEDEITDALLSYPCEVWLIGNTVIKAVLNYELLGRKPYYVTSYEKIPGKLDGNGVPDLCRDSQNVCNSAVRSLNNNMGISSGPQVGVNISRIATGEKITQMFPWKIWQFKASDYNDGSAPIQFFQPNSNAQELMAVFERFNVRADEDTGIPRYMTGEHVPGVGRTSSGLSMLINNAGKGIKQVINNIDKDVIAPLIERLYHHNLRYHPDPDTTGDLRVVATGAMSLVVKEAEAVRRNEFLQLVLNSPVAQQIVGLPGTAELLRDAALNLKGNVDKIVPPREIIEEMVKRQQEQQLQLMQAQMQPGVEGAQVQRGADGGANGAALKKPRELLPDGSQQGGRASNTVSSRPNGV